MSLLQLRNVNFGSSRANATGSTGVGYAIIDTQGITVTPRTIAGVYQLLSGSGLYAAYVTFPDTFRGQLLWDTGVAFSSVTYAVEEYNFESNNPRVDDTWQMVNSMTGSVQQLVDIGYGRWKIDVSTKQMIFYRADNVTEVARFSLFDQTGTPNIDAVFERVKV